MENMGKKVIILFFTIFVLIIGGCSSDSKNNAKVDFGENKTSGDAGELSAMKLKEEEKPDGLGSGLYDMELNSSYDKPITIKIPISEEETSEEDKFIPLLGIGTEVTFQDGSNETFYQYVDAEIEEGYAIATYVPTDYLGGTYVRGNSNGGSSTGTPSKEKLKLGIFWCSTTFVDGGHFIVYFPAKAFKVFIPYNERETLLNDLEAVYNQYIQSGYTYSKRTNWPITVNIQNISDEGYYTYGFDGAAGSISINKKFFEGGYQSASVKPLLAHEFFHFVQLNYETSSTDNLWFDEATATYFESKELGNIPSIVNEYKEHIFTGVIPVENTAADGYARMPIISYLSKELQEDFIRKAYEMVREGAQWDSALLSSMGPAQNWAGDFYKELVSGTVGDYSPYTLYSNISKGDMAQIGAGLALIIPTEEELKEAEENGEVPILGETLLAIDGYGAKLVALTIDDENLKLLPEDMNPTIKVNGNAVANVFVIKGKSFNTLEGVGGAIELVDFAKSIKEKKVYLVLITGLHESGKQDYVVTVEMPMFPTLDELVGNYTDGSLFFKDIFISDKLKLEAAEGSNEESYCDLDILSAIEGMEGQTKPMTLVISKTGENTGALLFQEEDEEATEESEQIPFTYTNGNIVLDFSKEGAILTGAIKASYGKNKDVLINGPLLLKMGEDISIELVIQGSKPL